MDGWGRDFVALLAGVTVAVMTTPAGVSGAVLLLPFQVSVLGTPSPAVTPTNLLYNVVATPGALWRYRQQGQRGGSLLFPLLLGTFPGVVAGSIVRVELLPAPRPFEVVVALVLIPMSLWLLFGRVRAHATQWPSLSTGVIVALAACVGCVGGIYGIGGGSILAPILISSGRPSAEVAPATLAATLLTSIAGVCTFLVLAAIHGNRIGPDWTIGLALGAGGLVGGYLGARLQPTLPESLIRRLLGVLIIAIGVRYLWLALG